MDRWLWLVILVYMSVYFFLLSHTSTYVYGTRMYVFMYTRTCKKCKHVLQSING